MLAKGRGGWSVSQKRIVIRSETIRSEYHISSASVHWELVARGCEGLLVSFICNVLLALGCPPTSPLNQRFALIEKLVFTLCCGWGGWLVYLVLQLNPIIWHQIVWSRDQNFDMVATQSFLGRLSNPSWSHQSTKRQCYLPNQNKTQAYVGTIRGILLVAYFSIVPLFDSWLCYICNIYLTSP